MNSRVLGVLGGRDLPLEMLRKWAESADRILAADSGADQVLALGMVPEMVVGDMDSISETALQSAKEAHVDTDQDITDCDKLLQVCAALDIAKLTLCGVEGDRLDHVLSTLYSCVRSHISIRLALRRGLGFIVKPGRHSFITSPNQRLSLLPLGKARDVVLKGVRWELEGQELAPDGMVSVSNFATASCIDVEISEGAALLVLEYPPAEMPVW